MTVKQTVGSGGGGGGTRVPLTPIPYTCGGDASSPIGLIFSFPQMPCRSTTMGVWYNHMSEAFRAFASVQKGVVSV